MARRTVVTWKPLRQATAPATPVPPALPAATADDGGMLKEAVRPVDKQAEVTIARNAVAGGIGAGWEVQAMNEMSAAPNSAAEIANVIDEISCHTRLLALNAAIEAARVGARGHAFAAAACEVRKLALRGAQAAAEISALIGDRAVSAGQEPAPACEPGASLAGFGAAVAKMSDIIAEFAAASSQHRADIELAHEAILRTEPAGGWLGVPSPAACGVSGSTAGDRDRDSR